MHHINLGAFLSLNRAHQVAYLRSHGFNPSPSPDPDEYKITVSTEISGTYSAWDLEDFRLVLDDLEEDYIELTSRWYEVIAADTRELLEMFDESTRVEKRQA